MFDALLLPRMKSNCQHQNQMDLNTLIFGIAVFCPAMDTIRMRFYRTPEELRVCLKYANLSSLANKKHPNSQCAWSVAF